MSLKEKILKLKQETNSITYYPLLDAIDLETISKIEKDSIQNHFLKKVCNRIGSCLDKIKISDYDYENLREIYSKYQ
jgi:hypothetical protein